MSENRTQTFVLSCLQKNNYNSAYRGELICDESTGEFLVKRMDDGIISYDAASRRFKHIETLTDMCDLYGFHGDMYEIFDDKNIFPMSIKPGLSIINSPVIIDTVTDKLIISVDCDIVACDNLDSYIYDTITVTIKMTGLHDDTIVARNIKSVYPINSSDDCVIILPTTKPSINKLRIDSIKLSGSTNSRAIVHGILIGTNI